MKEKLFNSEDEQIPLHERFNARREMINQMIQMGVSPKPVRFETPRGAINATKLKALGEQLLQSKTTPANDD